MEIFLRTAEEVEYQNKKAKDNCFYAIEMCGECCCQDADLIAIDFGGPDSSILLCRKCLDVLFAKTSPLSILLTTGKNTG